jgi:hypothetical protein
LDGELSDGPRFTLQTTQHSSKEIEELTKDTTARYATLKVRVEARAAFEQATDLRRELEEMGKETRGEALGLSDEG